MGYENKMWVNRLEIVKKQKHGLIEGYCWDILLDELMTVIWHVLSIQFPWSVILQIIDAPNDTGI